MRKREIKKIVRFLIGLFVLLLVAVITSAPVFSDIRYTYEKAESGMELIGLPLAYERIFLTWILEADAFFSICYLYSEQRDRLFSVFCGITLGLDILSILMPYVAKIMILWMPFVLLAVFLLRAAQGIVWVFRPSRKRELAS